MHIKSETLPTSFSMEIINSDVCGRNKLNDFSHFSCFYLNKWKNGVFEISRLWSNATLKFNLLISKFRSDHGTEIQLNTYQRINWTGIHRKAFSSKKQWPNEISITKWNCEMAKDEVRAIRIRITEEYVVWNRANCIPRNWRYLY